MVSFRAALDAGLDGLETDVHLTADGHLVLHHDPTLPGGHAIATMALADVRSLAPQVPLLEELVALLEEFPAARVNLELKSAAPHRDDRADALSRALAGWRDTVRARVWLSTFDRQLLHELDRGVRSRDLDVGLALLFSGSDDASVPTDVRLVAVHPHHALVNRESVATWHAAGLAVHTWTVNEPVLARRLIEDGVDGLIGDVPEVLLAARKQESTRGS